KKITVTRDATDPNKLTIATAADVTFDSVTTGNTTMNSGGVTVNDGTNSTTIGAGTVAVTDGTTTTTTGANGVTIVGGANGDVSLTGTGLNNGNNTITNVAPGVNGTRSEER